MTESLTQALHDANFLRQDLQAALSASSEVESLLLLPLIERSALLCSDISALLSAKGASHEN